MATPSGAKHRDLEQRFRDIEKALRALTAAALHRKQLAVTEGDFTVTGGGGIRVLDGGFVNVLHPGGNNEVGGVWLGDVVTSGVYQGTGVGVYDTLNREILYVGTTGGNTEKGSIRIGGSSRVVENVQGYASDFIWLDANTQVVLNVNGASAGQVQVLTSGVKLWGDVTLPNGQLDVPVMTTTSSGANVNWNSSNGRLRVNTSSLRFKDNVETATVDTDAALALEPKTFTRKDEDENAEGTRYIGFIAEEADALGLSPWITYDDEGEPWAFDYSQWCVALQAVCRKQQEQLDAQADQIAALTARLDALEAAA